MINVIARAVLIAWLTFQSPDYVCPMHSDVRLPYAGRCVRCGMPLVKAPSPAEPEYVMDLTANWSRTANSADIELQFATADGTPVQEFTPVHERELHLMIVGSSLDHFAHVHPARRSSGGFGIHVEFPEPGAYMLFADFVPAGGGPQLLQRMLVTPTASHASAAGVSSPRPHDFRIVEGLRIERTVEELRAGTPALITFVVSDAQYGTPLADLEPYLGASGHLFVTSADFQDAAHGHPLEDNLGPQVRFLVRFARQGRYRAWLQIQRHGKVVTSDWSFDVPDR